MDMKHCILLISCFIHLNVCAQDAAPLIKKLRAKMDQVNDYKATGNLKTDVSFLKIPVSRVNVFYRKPDRFRIKKEGGISLLPKGGVSINPDLPDHWRSMTFRFRLRGHRFGVTVTHDRVRVKTTSDKPEITVYGRKEVILPGAWFDFKKNKRK